MRTSKVTHCLTCLVVDVYHKHRCHFLCFRWRTYQLPQLLRCDEKRKLLTELRGYWCASCPHPSNRIYPFKFGGRFIQPIHNLRLRNIQHTSERHTKLLLVCHQRRGGKWTLFFFRIWVWGEKRTGSIWWNSLGWEPLLSLRVNTSASFIIPTITIQGAIDYSFVAPRRLSWSLTFSHCVSKHKRSVIVVSSRWMYFQCSSHMVVLLMRKHSHIPDMSTRHWTNMVDKKLISIIALRRNLAEWVGFPTNGQELRLL